jgi:hypothetical protein
MLLVDDPKILSELVAAFEAYERALVQNDIEVVNGLFWNDPRTVRYGTRDIERQYGHAEIAEFRIRRGAVHQQRELSNRRATTFGMDFGVTTTEFCAIGSDKIGRQTQTWIRTPLGWKIASAHVSFGIT